MTEHWESIPNTVRLCKPIIWRAGSVSRRSNMQKIDTPTNSRASLAVRARNQQTVAHDQSWCLPWSGKVPTKTNTTLTIENHPAKQLSMKTYSVKKWGQAVSVRTARSHAKINSISWIISTRIVKRSLMLPMRSHLLKTKFQEWIIMEAKSFKAAGIPKQRAQLVTLTKD